MAANDQTGLDSMDVESLLAHRQQLADLESMMVTSLNDQRTAIKHVETYLSKRNPYWNRETRWRDPAAIARGIGGPANRLETGFPTVDAMTRGGLRQGRGPVVIGGAPGAGKTTWMVQLARSYALRGIPVLFYAADEPLEGILVRWGQLEGLSREELENGNEQARAALAEALARVPVLFVDQEDDKATFDEAIEELLLRAEGRPCAAFADSLQTIRVLGIELADNERARAKLVVESLKRADKRGVFTMATSELSRAFYANRKERIDPLAAFKESGAIEYGISLGLVLDNVPNRPGFVDVSTAKNRMGPDKKVFQLKQDYSRASFAEVDAYRPEDLGLPMRERVLKVLRHNTSCKSMNDVAKLMSGRKATICTVITEMIESGEIVMVGRFLRPAPKAFSGPDSGEEG